MDKSKKRVVECVDEVADLTQVQNERFANSKRNKHETSVSRTPRSETSISRTPDCNTTVSSTRECKTFVLRTPVEIDDVFRIDGRRVVHVDRSSEIESFRSDLPILGYEQEIMEALSNHDVIIICGPTGCGKTTQIPQFLYEAGFSLGGMIGITQVRRLAAISISKRVALELGNQPLGQLVGYQIRHETKISKKSEIKFMTDGVLLRELQSDFLVRNYTAIVIDEAHERSLNSDVLIGMLSRVLSLRRKLNLTPLKLIIMSATLEAGALFSNPKLFLSKPPILEIPTRQFPVTIHFTKVTEFENYEILTLKKVCKIHRELPLGGILVFLTGSRQIEDFCLQLRQALDSKGPISANGVVNKVKISPLYAKLSPDRQRDVFEQVDADTRHIIVSTNVAETSITIPDIRYVVDPGRSKQKHIHRNSSIASFDIEWISKASAIQRTGRAGRTTPGQCYRLYSSTHYTHAFPEQDPPEIHSIPLENLVLLLKSMGIEKMLNFPFPSPPDAEALSDAEGVLIGLGAVDLRSKKITNLGKKLCDFPITPRHSKMIFEAIEIEKKCGIQGVTLLAISLAASMSVENPILQIPSHSNSHSNFRSKKSDSLSSLLVLLAFKRSHSNLTLFCKEWGLSEKQMSEMMALERQLLKIFFHAIPKTHEVTLNDLLTLMLPDPTDEVLDCLRRCILAGWCDQVCRKQRNFGVQKTRTCVFQSGLTDDEFLIHPRSSLHKSSPEFVVYVNAMVVGDKTYLQEVTKVDPEWLFKASRVYCEVIENPSSVREVVYDFEEDEVCVWRKVSYGKHQWELPLQKVKCQDLELTASCFASVLLEGKVFGQQWISDQKLMRNAKYAKTIEVKFNQKLGLLILKLKEEGVGSKDNLRRKMSVDSEFLKEEMKLWIKKQHWTEFEQQWNQWIDQFVNKG